MSDPNGDLGQRGHHMAAVQQGKLRNKCGIYCLCLPEGCRQRTWVVTTVQEDEVLVSLQHLACCTTGKLRVQTVLTVSPSSQ